MADTGSDEATEEAGDDSYAFDDTIVYEVIDGSAVAIRLPFPVRLEPAVRAALPAALFPAAEASSAPLVRIYDLVRDMAVDPLRPAFLPVDPAQRFERLLAHAHPLDMGGDERRRAFIEHLLAVARGVELWECRFAPGLEHLHSLAAAIRAHIDRPEVDA